MAPRWPCHKSRAAGSTCRIHREILSGLPLGIESASLPTLGDRGDKITAVRLALLLLSDCLLEFRPGRFPMDFVRHWAQVKIDGFPPATIGCRRNPRVGEKDRTLPSPNRGRRTSGGGNTLPIDPTCTRFTRFNTGEPTLFVLKTKPKPRWDVHLLSVGSRAGSLAGMVRPLTAGQSGSAVSPRLSG